MSYFILKRVHHANSAEVAMYYKHAGQHGYEHEWSARAEDAWHFPFQSVPQSALDNDQRLHGAVIEEIK